MQRMVPIPTALLPSQPCCWQPAHHHSFRQVFPVRAALPTPHPWQPQRCLGVPGLRTHDLARRGLWASSPMMCSRQGRSGPGWATLLHMPVLTVEETSVLETRGWGWGWWHQPPGLQGPVHFAPYNHFPAWARGSALDSKTHTQGAFDEGSMG